ncbi:MAG: hypothetical protein QOH71_3958 [Blastocatellia bacterium]|jgi:hypothetical protein|nr:hypothetical protein [Blastocatellia bacterium]
MTLKCIADLVSEAYQKTHGNIALGGALKARGLVKAKNLLLSRGILDSLHNLNLSREQTHDYWNALLTLQASIFELDYYGEENWAIDAQALKEHWKQIEMAADALHSSIRPELKSIRAYQEVEMAIRSGNPVARMPIHVFYVLKSCDVRLIKGFLARVALSAGVRIPDSSATQFLSVIHEVKDDLDDLSEDILTFNGNRIMSACAVYGSKHALREYVYFLHGAIRDAQQKCAELHWIDEGESHEVWMDVVETTANLIRAFSESYTLDHLEHIERQLTGTQSDKKVA